MNHRRLVLKSVGAAALAAPLAALGQTPGKVWRVGVLSPSTLEGSRRFIEAIPSGLAEYGWIEGRHFILEKRFADEDAARLSVLAHELVALKVDVIVAFATTGAVAAKAATTVIPIVFGSVSDPVASALVASLPHPGGNLTGWSIMLPETSGKTLSLLKELAPATSRVAVMYNAGNPGKLLDLAAVQAAAQVLGITIQPAPVRTLGDISAFFSSQRPNRPNAIFVLAEPLMSAHREQIARLAALNRLPDLYQVTLHVEAGGLLSYGPNLARLFSRTAYYLDRIMRGAKPNDLPVEQPTHFEMAINMKTAKVLGLTVPPLVLLQATRLIE